MSMSSGNCWELLSLTANQTRSTWQGQQQAVQISGGQHFHVKLVLPRNMTDRREQGIIIRCEAKTQGCVCARVCRSFLSLPAGALGLNELEQHMKKNHPCCPYWSSAASPSRFDNSALFHLGVVRFLMSLEHLVGYGWMHRISSRFVAPPWIWTLSKAQKATSQTSRARFAVKVKITTHIDKLAHWSRYV